MGCAVAALKIRHVGARSGLPSRGEVQSLLGTPCPFCGSTRVRHTFVYTLPNKAVFMGIGLGFVVFIVVELVLAWLGWSDLWCVGPVSGATIALAVWFWYIRKHWMSLIRGWFDDADDIIEPPGS